MATKKKPAAEMDADTAEFDGAVPAGKVDLDDNPDAPKITGQVEAAGSKRVLNLGDEVVLFTPNPINGQTRNMATVTRLNSDGTINAAVKRGDGQVVELNSIKNSKPDAGDISAYWQWAVDGETAKA